MEQSAEEYTASDVLYSLGKSGLDFVVERKPTHGGLDTIVILTIGEHRFEFFRLEDLRPVVDALIRAGVPLLHEPPSPPTIESLIKWMSANNGRITFMKPTEDNPPFIDVELPRQAGLIEGSSHTQVPTGDDPVAALIQAITGLRDTWGWTTQPLKP